MECELDTELPPSHVHVQMKISFLLVQIAEVYTGLARRDGGQWLDSCRADPGECHTWIFISTHFSGHQHGETLTFK